MARTCPDRTSSGSWPTRATSRRSSRRRSTDCYRRSPARCRRRSPMSRSPST
jgi:hypothetical protein